MIFYMTYKDKLLLPVMVLIMSAINLFIVYPDQVFSYPFLRAFIEDSIECLICWWLMRSSIIALDSYFPYSRGVFKRILLQNITSLIISCSALILMTALMHEVLNRGAIPEVMFTHHIWVYAFWVLIQNAVYVIMYLNASVKAVKIESESNRTKQEAQNLKIGKKIKIKSGKRIRLIDEQEILYFKISGKYVVLCEVSHEFEIVDASMEEVETMVSQILFYRLNRQYIIRRDLIQAVQSESGGKLSVELLNVPGLESTVTVSRTKAQYFKKWIQEDPYQQFNTNFATS